MLARTSQLYHLCTPLGPWIAWTEMIDETYSHRHPPDPGLWIVSIPMTYEIYLGWHHHGP